MKFIQIILAVTVILLSSCHKSDSSTSTAPTVPISGLTSMRFTNIIDSDIYLSAAVLAWNFSGTDSIHAESQPYHGSIRSVDMVFTGNLVTKLVYHSTYPNNTNDGIVVNVSYTSAGYIDTITFLNQWVGNKKFTFEYSGSQLKDAYAAKINSSTGNYDWTNADRYIYTYTGDNITMVSGSSSNPILRYKPVRSFFTSGQANNFSGSWSAFLLQSLIRYSNHYYVDCALELPKFLNKNLIDSYYNGATQVSVYKYQTESRGRVTQATSKSYYVLQGVVDAIPDGIDTTTYNY